MRISTLAVAAASLAIIGSSGGIAVAYPGAVPAHRPVVHRGLDSGNGNLRVMTYNADEGTDYIEVSQAQTQQQFLLAVGQTITQVRATNPPARMQAIASQILASRPNFVGLEEMDQWYTGPFDPQSQTCGQVSLEFDMLAELMAALAAQGGHYRAIVQAQQFAFPPVPGLILPGTFLCVSVINTNVILVRTDINANTFSYGNPQSGQFVNRVFLQTPIGTIPIPRAWESVDGSFHGVPFRFLSTHLEASDANIRELQGGELRAGPANVSVPVVIAMDSNAQAAPMPQDPTYLDFLNAGYSDVWSQLEPQVPGLTCCQAQFDNNPVSQLYQRIDLVLTHGPVIAKSIGLFGANPGDFSNGLWPSDHAGVAAEIRL
jgi:hypothetical protein